MIIDEIISTSASSSTISLPNRQTDDHIQRSIYNVIIQNNVEKLTEILKNKNNINFDINQPLIKTKVKKFKSDGEKEIYEENDGEIGDHKNALMVACSLDCINIVRFLLSRTNINIDLQDKNGETALYLASALGNIKMVKLLLSYNANLDIYNKDKATPLIISSFNGHNGVVKALLSKCKNVNFQDNLCKTALSFAALEGHPQVVELLLKKGADVNLPDKLGWTPLMLAAFVGRANICRQLLIAKADKNLRTNDNKTASILAREGGFHHVAEMIDQFNLNLDPSDILLNPPNILLNSSNMSSTCSYDEEYGRKSESRFSRHSRYSENIDSRRISTGSRLRMEMLPREENTWWVYLSWIVTIFFLDRFLIRYGKMNDERIRQAWREKVALCFIILMTSVFIALLTFGFAGLACSSSLQTPLSVINELWSENSVGNDKVMIVRGKIYNVGEYFKYGGHRPINPFNDEILEPIINQYYGKDVGELFPVNNVAIGCNRSPDINGFCNTPEPDARYHCHTSMNSHKTLESLSINRYVSISWDEITNSPFRKLLAYKGMVYDLTEYLSASNADKWLGLDNDTTTWLEKNLIGKDATSDILNTKNNDIKEAIKCLENFQVGTVEGLQYGCATTKVIIMVITGVVTIFSIMKLLCALIFDNYLSNKLAKTDNIVIEDITNDIILMVPCYSEGHKSMKNSFDSLAATHYPDQNKIFFIVADGNITGSGNDKSTPDILLDFIVPFDKSFYNVKAKSYLSLGEGTKRHNMAKVYSGYYRYQDKDIPTILIIKVGNPEESKYPRAGNRGKRDSQLILMQLLQHAFNNDEMTPLEFDIFEKFRKLTRKTIDQYEFVVMVDADTIVKEDSINNMISCMNNDSSIIGLCGETKILNTTYNWVTMIQVFEYYLSHHLGKPFESVYACVTCLPGCFCMYRIFSYNHDGFRVPILIDENVMSNYSTTEVDTLHQKNLLLLGEDRYLTTLMLRAFPKRRTMYCPSAVCETIVPTEFKVLLSQRRRWINGTIHNMFELIASSELPGRFCFSMQLAVFLDLFGTFTSPFALSYILSSIIAMLFGHSSQSALYITIIFMVQIFLAIFTSYSPIVVMWFFVFLISLPIWYIILPLYSFWNFDDFSWGATRKLNDDGNSSYSDTIFDRFDPKSVPRKKWKQWIKSTSRHLTVNPFY